MVNKEKLQQYKENHDKLHLASGRSEQFIKEKPDFNKETFQLNLFLGILDKLVDSDVTKPNMIELGTSSFPTYSKAFTDIFPEGKSICTEILIDSFISAKKILPNSSWYHCYNGKQKHLQENVPTKEQIGDAKLMSMNELFTKEKISFLDILHIDIQGAENEVLKELDDDKLYLKIKYMFISIHGIECFNYCLSILNKWNIKTIFQHPTQGGYGDGLIVCEIIDNQ